VSAARKLACFVGQKLAEGLLTSAGQQIGEAIGKRIGAKIYRPPPAPDKPDEKAAL
jgi:hypothetical protein